MSNNSPKILVVNSGSSSLKAKLFEAFDLSELKSFNFSMRQGETTRSRALKNLISELAQNADTIKYIGYRVVMGGEGAQNGELASASVIQRIRRFSHLAPLHNPPALDALNKLSRALPHASNIIVYDTAFFNDLPEEEKTLPIDKNISSHLKMRKFGFHGISHQHMSELMSHHARLVTIHLGAGCSASAILNGYPVATSMSYTPQAGLIMQSRSGDIDPGVIFELVRKFGFKRAMSIIDSKSGLKGISGTDGSMLTILALSGAPIEEPTFKYTGPNNQHLRHQSYLALEMYCQRVKDFIGSYAARMGGLDAIAFSGNIGYGSKFLRDKITYGLDFLNLKEVVAIVPDEEFAIAKIIKNKYY